MFSSGVEVRRTLVYTAWVCVLGTGHKVQESIGIQSWDCKVDNCGFTSFSRTSQHPLVPSSELYLSAKVILTVFDLSPHIEGL